MTDYKESNKLNEVNVPLKDTQIIDKPITETVIDTHITSEFHIEDDNHFDYADYKIEDWLAFVLFWLLAITVFAQFMSRYVFESPLGWTEEIARYQLVCLGFLGSCIGVRNNSHIFVMLFHRWISEKLSHNIYRIIALCNVLFFGVLAYFAWQIIPLLSIHKMASLPVSISVLYSFVFGSLLILIFRSLQHFIKILSAPAPKKADDILSSCD